MPLARLRASGELLELGRGRSSRSTTRTPGRCSRSAGLALRPTRERLNARAEGWAGGLYLAALALRGQAAGAAAAAAFGGRRPLRDRLPARRAPRSAAGASACASCADLGPRAHVGAALRRRARPLRLGGGARALVRDNLFVVPLDRSGPLVPLPPPVPRPAARRARARRPGGGRGPAPAARPAWLAANGMPDAAIEHATPPATSTSMARPDRRPHAFPFYRSGRAATMARWLARRSTTRARSTATRPSRSLGTWMHALRGRTDAANRWAASVEASDVRRRPCPMAAPSLRAWAALRRALLCRPGARACTRTRGRSTRCRRRRLARALAPHAARRRHALRRRGRRGAAPRVRGGSAPRRTRSSPVAVGPTPRSR